MNYAVRNSELNLVRLCSVSAVVAFLVAIYWIMPSAAIQNLMTLIGR